MVKRLRVADPLPWLLLVGGLFASLWILPLSLFQSQTFNDSRTSTYNEWICGQSSNQPRYGCRLVLIYPEQPAIKVSATCMSKSSLCRVGFAYDIEMESQKIQADIDQMQRQLELFDNSSTVTSAYTQMHAVEADGLASLSARTDRNADISAQAESELQPFLFVGVLSVAGNAGP